MLNPVLRSMYTSYVRNSKFVSPNTLPGINFMRHSLVEMFCLDLNSTYQHAFLYIRQLAIHLRNAIILKKKDSYQALYNWQYVNSLRLWSQLLCATVNDERLQALIYPLVTIILGVTRLTPTAQYFPYRFHCTQILIDIMKGTDQFIPVLAYLLEPLRNNTFNRKHTAVSMRPIQFTCILRLNKTQLAQNGFRDETVEQICAQMLECFAHLSNVLGFPELVVPTIFQFRAYLKICRNANYARKIKQLLEKLRENSKFIEEERSRFEYEFHDIKKIRGLEAQIRAKGTPLDIYYASWLKTHEVKKRREAAQTDDINDTYGLPSLKKQQQQRQEQQKRKEEDVELFPTDDEDDEQEAPTNLLETMDVDKKSQTKSKMTKENKKMKLEKVKKEGDQEVENTKEFDIPVEEPDEEQMDIVKDLDLNDW